jgi:hypothetical protein
MQLFVFALFATLLSLLSSATAVPIDLYPRDVFVPRIIAPTTGDVWTVGSTVTVEWDTSNHPKQITNPQGKVVLVTNGMLDFDHPIASGFDILLGKHDIIVPSVQPGVYQIVLFGDSGNFSKNFTIVAHHPHNSAETEASDSNPLDWDE